MVSAVAIHWSLVLIRLALCVALLCAGLSAADDYEGRTVSAILFDPPLGLSVELPLSIGQPYRASAVRESLQNLYSTGEYTDISVDVQVLEAGLQVTFVTQPTYFLGHIEVEGIPEPPNGGQLASATKLQLGAEFVDQDVSRAVESLRDLLRRNGFYEVSIVAEVRRNAATHQANLRFAIDAGPRARFDGVEVTGTPVRTPEKITWSTGWKPLRGMLPWRTFTEARLQSGLENIRAWYQKNNRLTATAALARLDYRQDTNRVTPNIRIEAGPALRVRLHGAKMSGARLRALLPIYQERTVDDELLNEGRRNLVGYFQSRGYFEAGASFDTEREANGDQLIEYQVDRGQRHRLAVLRFEGNRYFDDMTLRERMYLLPATVFRYRFGRYSREYLEKDLGAIRELYRSNGFRDVAVTAREEDDYKGRADEIAVFIEIREGPQSFVSKLEIEGAGPLAEVRLREILHSTEGQPYSEASVASDRDAALEYFFNNGYPNARFEFTVTSDAEPNRFALRFRIEPGARETVRGVLVSGLRETRESVVRSRIALGAGDPLSQGLITESQRRLYDLGIFARVNSALQNPEGVEDSKYVVYSLEEARRYAVNVGLGAEIARIGGGTTTLDSPAGTTGFSPRVSLGVSRLNVFGLGHTLSLQTRVSTLQQRALVSYIAPRIGGNPKLTLQVSGLFDISKDVRTFSARREEGSAQLSRRLSKASTSQFRFTFRRVNILGTPLVTPELIPLLSQPVRVGLLGASFVQDRRDDPTDAHRGVYNTVDVSLASKVLGSQTAFGRVVARNATYYRLTRGLTLARATYFGLIERYAGLEDIPLAERFFSGGSSSQRAFPDNQAGPRDLKTGFPVGGNALLVNNVELRFPLIGENIGGVLFNDLGNVYSDVSKISLRWNQKGLGDFDYAVQSFGFGVRYRTPIGPVRVDLSLSPNSPRFFGFQGTRDQLLFGGGSAVVQRISVFQFHFSLGQAF